MTWLEKDIEDLVDLKDEWCREHNCQECGFNTNINKPCLDQAVNSLGFTLEHIKKAQGGLKNMYNIIEHLFLETGFPVWGLLALGVIAMIIDNWEELTK